MIELKPSDTFEDLARSLRVAAALCPQDGDISLEFSAGRARSLARLLDAGGLPGVLEKEAGERRDCIDRAERMIRSSEGNLAAARRFNFWGKAYFACGVVVFALAFILPRVL